MQQYASEPPIEETIAETLRDREERVAVAEGCTGGLVGSLLTDVPGTSDYLDRVLVPYSYDSLRELLAISREALDTHGVVSAPVTEEIARATRDTAKVTWGIATTGVAGPDGGTADIPVGTGFVAVAHAADWGTEASGATVSRYEFPGSRREVKEQLARQALRDLDARATEESV
jgi:nicotinamide-nucleotide amidase